ncbi:MAG TPA: DNA polymerase III subunit chi [Parachlamydiaceae bacterium]|nr:DNA polymerase III subunit chi [Parachlamydiaceae bacterium]
MTTTKLTRVCFIRVTDNASKLQKLCAMIHDHFIKKDKVLIVVPSTEAAKYIDQLLWRMPEESFVPHAIASGATKEQIAITTNLTNLNSASVLVNLLSNIHPNPGPVDLIYELLDLTSKEKEEISRKKQDNYRNAGHVVEEIL